MTKYPGGALIPSLNIDRSDPARLSMQLATKLRDMILSGELPRGTRLPATRILARDHGVSRTTAVTVYEQLASEGMTMIVVTHEMGFAREVADELVFMDAGVVVERGNPREVMSNPQHERTKAFLSKVM